jgi:hypothetical protein
LNAIAHGVSLHEQRRRAQRALLVPTQLSSVGMIDYALQYLLATGDFARVDELRAQAVEQSTAWQRGGGAAVCELSHESERFLTATKGRVYFFSTTYGPFVKIGFSDRPWRRVEQVHFRRGDRCDVELHLPGGRLHETYLHRLFNRHRVEREWFSYCDEIHRFLHRAVHLQASGIP